MNKKQNLNKSQLKAVRHGKGPMLVLAGPGSGKTMVIVHRISNLIKQHGISPENILVVTFSRAAAREMEKRFYENIQKENRNIPYDEVTFGTVHSVFLNILSSFYDVKPDEISYDDMLLLTHKLLLERPEVLSSWQRKYQYILVDEFQDISRVQYDTLNLLAGKSANIFVVGDDDQSIYGFRGASPGVLKKFVKDHKRCRKVLLNVNYRCNKKIMKKSLALISINKDRFDKRIKAYNRHRIKNCVRLKAFENNEDEFKYISEEIKLNLECGKKAEDIAILFRNHHDYGPLVKIFEQKKIPYVLKTTETVLENSRQNNKAVNIMTMHASKGLEFNTVYLPCLNEGIIPSRKAKTKDAVYEERRLMYVATTRAKNHLFLSYSENINYRRAKPSQFLNNMLLKNPLAL